MISLWLKLKKEIRDQHEGPSIGPWTLHIGVKYSSPFQNLEFAHRH